MRGKKKVRREIDAALARHALNQRAPSPWNAVALPFVDRLLTSLTAAPGYFLAPQRGCESCPAAELFDEVCVSFHKVVIRKRFGFVKPETSAPNSGDNTHRFPQAGGMASRPKKVENVEAGRRLIRTREALGHNRRRFAQLMDEEEDNLEKWENGVARPATRYLRKLGAAHGVTYEWIFDGNMARLPYDLVLKLLEQGASVTEEDAAE